MKKDTKVILLIGALTIGVIMFIMFGSNKSIDLDKDIVSRGKNIIGNESAQTFLVEFSDFQCPACKSAEPFIAEILNNNKDKLKFIYRHFPLPQHQFAYKAAVAAEAAGAQGKFWEYKEKVFQNQDSLSDTKFPEIAKELKLDMAKFDKDRAASEAAQIVNTDKSDGEKLSVNATPTFFLNGEKIVYTSFDGLQTTIESKLK